MKKGIKNKFGQYFTPEIVANFMVELSSINKEGYILEPCCGEGVFLKNLNDKGFKNIMAYEIDPTLANLFSSQVIYKSFVSENIEEKFDLIIGNPPYIRWQHLEEDFKTELSKNHLWNKYFNSLCDYLYIFILKSIELLKENGELIFICPEYWLNTTHSISLRNYMVANGYFESIHHFNETPIFENVTVSIIIFKYIKNKNHNKTKISVAKYFSARKLTKSFLDALRNKEPQTDLEYFDIDQFKVGERWVLAPDEVKTELKIFETNCIMNGSFNKNLFEEAPDYHTIGEICDIGNGLVSGLDRAFQLNGHLLNEQEAKSIINVVKAKDIKPYYPVQTTRYIFLKDNLNENELKEIFPVFYEHLMEFKNELLSRYQYNREINFWEWVFLRNFNLFSKNEYKIFVPCKERISNKNHFRFALIEPNVYPTQDVTALFKKEKTKESIYYILAMLNNHRTFNWLKYNGIVKGNIVEFSEKPISSIPIKLIDWSDEFESNLHNNISNLCKDYIETKKIDLLQELETTIDLLFTNKVQMVSHIL